MWNLLFKYKSVLAGGATSIGLAIAAFTYHTTLINQFEKEVTDRVTTTIQLEQNKLIEQQRQRHDQALQAQLNQHAQDLIDAEKARDEYWNTYYAARQADLIAEYETRIAAEGIKNEASTIDDVLGDDTVRLLNNTRSLVSPPADYDYRVAGSPDVTGHRPESVGSLLSRLAPRATGDE